MSEDLRPALSWGDALLMIGHQKQFHETYKKAAEGWVAERDKIISKLKNENAELISKFDGGSFIDRQRIKRINELAEREAELLKEIEDLKRVNRIECDIQEQALEQMGELEKENERLRETLRGKKQQWIAKLALSTEKESVFEQDKFMASDMTEEGDK